MNLINWPPEGDRHRHTGEGGMFAYAVITHDDAAPVEFCTVDCSLHLTQPDVCVNPGPPQENPWAPWDSDGPGHSDPMTAAVYLGSTGLSLWDETTGGYFQATPGHLTPAGRALYQALEGAYGVTPRIYTFLDT